MRSPTLLKLSRIGRRGAEISRIGRKDKIGTTLTQDITSVDSLAKSTKCFILLEDENKNQEYAIMLKRGNLR